MSSSKLKSAYVQIAAYQTALELNHLDLGCCPQSTDGLAALAKAPVRIAGWAGPYLDKSGANDRWVNPCGHTASVDGTNYKLRSLGANGIEGGDGEKADISA